MLKELFTENFIKGKKFLTSDTLAFFPIPNDMHIKLHHSSSSFFLNLI